MASVSVKDDMDFPSGNLMLRETNRVAEKKR